MTKGFLFHCYSLKEFLPQTWLKQTKVEKKILAKHKELKGFNELDAKVKYVKLARGLPTFGVHFFLVKVRSMIITLFFSISILIVYHQTDWSNNISIQICKIYVY